jgi:hypothetical protein
VNLTNTAQFGGNEPISTRQSNAWLSINRLPIKNFSLIIINVLFQGDFVKAREMAEKLFAQLNEKLAKASSPSDAFFNGISPAIQAEVQAFSNCWIK